MTSIAERLQRILAQPLDYVHPQRLQLPPEFAGSEARCALNRLLVEGLGQPQLLPATPQTAVAQAWIRQWQQLPYIAALMGAWRLFPYLSRGAALQALSLPVRRFAGCRPGRRPPLPVGLSSSPMQQVEVAGLNALCSWSDVISPSLLARLPLQFSAEVVELHKQWPEAEPDQTLFFLAVQHARLYPNPD